MPIDTNIIIAKQLTLLSNEMFEIEILLGTFTGQHRLHTTIHLRVLLS